eukprot:TRINITY_DN6321_c0_g1_i2.p1 TRINITY_DN6321_c0_g1~~TRINITY_DN6321_c0_g1_i2.p1  ORF type:complete len:782 (+),score=207.86 TRINITY_DN6321_c0_g1_i2:375-2720(+)
MWRVLIVSLLLVGTAVTVKPTLAQGTLPLWGTYRPNVYFGVKARIPKSPIFGIMWYDADNPLAADHVRHDCDDRDGVIFGWKKHDGARYGVQELLDLRGGVNLTTEFVAFNENEWSVRIRGQSLRNSGADHHLGLMYYWALEDDGDFMNFLSKSSSQGIHSDDVIIQLNFGTAGTYQMHIRKHPSSVHPEIPTHKTTKRRHKREYSDRANFFMLDATKVYNPDDRLKHRQSEGGLHEFWNVKEPIRKALSASYHAQESQLAEKREKEMSKGTKVTQLFHMLPNQVVRNSKILAVQHIFALPLEVDIDFRLVSEKNSENPPQSKDLTERADQLRSEFDSNFDATFPISNPLKYKSFAEYAFSSLIGGIGFFEGKWLKADPERKSISIGGPNELLTAVPCRSFFPRGFLWDEGFHLLPILRFNPEAAKAVVQSWFSLMNSNGWIAREQILGSEARSRVPPEFQVQEEDVANPPTLFLAIEKLLEYSTYHITQVSLEYDATSTGSLKQQSKSVDPFFENLYPSLKRHLLWYYETQVRKDDPHTFYWRGRTITHTLASGLDDYPRAPWLSDVEGHVDLHSWMTFMFQVMGRIAHHLGKEEDRQQFNEMSVKLVESLEENYWDSSKQMFADFAVHPNTSALHKFPHLGYVSLLPLALKLIPVDSPKLNAVLDALEDPDKVWSNYGILSLSKTDKFFGTSENYWRGPIWFNMNYLILDGLKYYGQHSKKADVLYHRLRENLIENVFNEYQRTGFLFEQYNPLSGQGQRQKPFTGWTSLVVLVLAEMF